MENATDDQRVVLERLGKRDDYWMEWDDHRGVAALVRGVDVARIDQDTDADGVLAAIEPVLDLVGPDKQSRRYRLHRDRRDDLGFRHVEYQQVVPTKVGDVDLYRGILAVHLANGAVDSIQSSCYRDPKPAPFKPIDPKALREVLSKHLDGARNLEALARLDEPMFPIMREPILVIYPWKDVFRPTYIVYAYGLRDPDEQVERPVEAELGKNFVDAESGERFLFAPMSRDVDNPDNGSGRGVTPLGGPFVSRALRIIRVDATSTYRLRDTTHGRDIITYDAENLAAYDTDAERLAGLSGGALPVSTDDDGDKNWSRTAASTSVADRTSSQQPEVDLHHFNRLAYEWYDALAGGRAGWDNNQFANPPVPPQPIRGIAHARDGTNAQSINAGMRLNLTGGNWLCWLQFFDGNVTDYDYLSGSRFIAGHEYQHAITDFNFEDTGGDPGLDYTASWNGAVHEGLSDVFGGLISDDWRPARDISPTGRIFRNIAYPRDSTVFSSGNIDHFGDRLTATGRYPRGVILAHTAYLLAAGGVHQRASRTPVHIPVQSAGRETVGGLDVSRAARIWYRAITWYFSTHGALTTIPTEDESMFRTIRNACVSAAIDYYGFNSREHRTTVLAFYAVGLHPAAMTYGADCTFLRWGAEWTNSRPYVGLTSPDWASRDLFVNNGGISEWNALANVLDSSGNPTTYENNVYCRVRNVGDQAATAVSVTFEYTKAGTAAVSWQPVTNAAGVQQVLTLGTLGAGQSNFPDSAQNSPPAAASVKWWIPPIGALESVDHYCLRARVTSSNDVNPHNNEVQSNVAYAAYVSGGIVMSFYAGNPTKEPVKAELLVSHKLPEGWAVRLIDQEMPTIKPGGEAAFKVVVIPAPGEDAQMTPPFDGAVEGKVDGWVSGRFEGVLSDARSDGGRLEGMLSATIEDLMTVYGRFEGAIDERTGEIKGSLTGSVDGAVDGPAQAVRLAVAGCLRPNRQIDIAQLVDGVQVGGVTIRVQVPRAGSCLPALPPTDTRVEAPRSIRRWPPFSERSQPIGEPRPTVVIDRLGEVVRLALEHGLRVEAQLTPDSESGDVEVVVRGAD